MLFGADQVNIETFCKQSRPGFTAIISSRGFMLQAVSDFSFIPGLVRTAFDMSRWTAIFSWNSRAAAYYPRGDGFWGLVIG